MTPGSASAMQVLTIFVIAVGLAIDAFAVSVAYGLSFTSRQHRSALAVSGTFGLFQAGMPVLGWLGGRALRDWISSFDHWVALLVLGYIGCKMIWEAVRAPEPAAVSRDLRTLLALGVATSIDALAVGLLLAVLHVPLLVPILIIGVVTFVISYAGVVAGHELRRAFSTWGRRGVQLVGGLILIGIGVKIVLEHLARGGVGAS